MPEPEPTRGSNDMEQTKMPAHQRAAIILRHTLRDGEWHDGASVRDAVRESAECSYVTVLSTLWAIGGDVENHGRGGSRWRLTKDAQQRIPAWDGSAASRDRLAIQVAKVQRLHRQADELEASLSNATRKAAHATDPRN